MTHNPCCTRGQSNGDPELLSSILAGIAMTFFTKGTRIGMHELIPSEERDRVLLRCRRPLCTHVRTVIDMEDALQESILHWREDHAA